MFGTIAADLENVEQFAAGNADPMIPQLTLRGYFDAEWGYPARYHRTQIQKVGSNLEASWQKVQTDESEFLAALGLPDQVPPEGAETPESLDELLEAWDEKLQTIGEDAQLANVDMQNMLQKQQQTMQMMSQISKMLHDVAMAVIRKMGG